MTEKIKLAGKDFKIEKLNILHIFWKLEKHATIPFLL
jgi:hypothetical protein